MTTTIQIERGEAVSVIDPVGKELIRVRVDPVTGKYVVDDHATGRVAK